MAYIAKRGKRWRAEVYRNGEREFETFATKAEAAHWALSRESILAGDKLPDFTVGDAMRRYAEKVSPDKRGARWEQLRLRKLQNYPLARVPLPRLSSAHVADWRDARKAEVSGATVRREMNLLGVVLSTAAKEWKWLHESPMHDVKRPPSKPSRRRRITQDEIDRACMALGYVWPAVPQNTSQRVALAFLFAVETAMRAGEILGLKPGDVHIADRYVNLPRTKNGDARQVPLSRKAIQILELLPNSVPVFGIEPGTRDALFRKARERAQLGDLRFHDSRAEAIWRLSKKLDVLQLARMIGHRDPRSLMFYYAETPTETASRLD